MKEIKIELTELKDQWNQGHVKNANYAFDIADNLIKRVEELENKIKILEKENNELTGIGGMWMSARNKLEQSQEQNQRYKQALEEIESGESVLFAPYDEKLWIVFDIVREALKGESK